MEERGIDPHGTSPVFVNLRGRPLTRWGVRYLLRTHARGAAATVPTVALKRIHPHTRSLPLRLLDNGRRRFSARWQQSAAARWI